VSAAILPEFEKKFFLYYGVYAPFPEKQCTWRIGNCQFSVHQAIIWKFMNIENFGVHGLKA
jgi:hypothetical protein